MKKLSSVFSWSLLLLFMISYKAQGQTIQTYGKIKEVGETFRPIDMKTIYQDDKGCYVTVMGITGQGTLQSGSSLDNRASNIYELQREYHPCPGTSEYALEKKRAEATPCTVYKHSKFRGDSKKLEVGSYNHNELGVGNDEISSLKVSHGYSVTVYEHGGYSGRFLVLRPGDHSSFNERWNDKISSIKVKKE